MENFNIVEILKLGLPGLVFLLSLFSFKLLSKEQEKSVPNENMLCSIKIFMLVNVFLSIMTISAPLIDQKFFVKDKIINAEATLGSISMEKGSAAVCYNVSYVNRYLLIKDIKTGRLIQVFASKPIPCEKKEHIGLSDEDASMLGWDSTASASDVEVVVAPAGCKFTI